MEWAPGGALTKGWLKGFWEDPRPISERPWEEVVHAYRALYVKRNPGIAVATMLDPVSFLLHKEREDVLAGISHLAPKGLFVLYRPVVAVGATPLWRCAEARVSSVGREGGLGWRPGRKGIGRFGPGGSGVWMGIRSWSIASPTNGSSPAPRPRPSSSPL